MDLTPNRIKLQLKDGDVEIQLFNQVAPKHAAQIKKLIKNKFYDGLKWHRVIDGFMAQTGCPNGDGTGSAGNNVPGEFSTLPFERGTVGMARSQDLNSASSQFFICFQRVPNLDGQYTVIGQVVSGMEFVDNIKKGDRAKNGSVETPDTLIKVTMVK